MSKPDKPQDARNRPPVDEGRRSEDPGDREPKPQPPRPEPPKVRDRPDKGLPVDE